MDKMFDLSGENVFRLVDTYGMPLELITEIAGTKKLKIDMSGYEKLMEERKEMSRKGSDISNDFIFKPDDFIDAPIPEYSSGMPLIASIAFVVKEGITSDEINEGENAEIITSPQSSILYAEAGGQSGDTGLISDGVNEMILVNTVEADGRKILQVQVKKGSFKKGSDIKLEIDFLSFSRKFEVNQKGEIVVFEQDRRKRATVSKERQDEIKRFFPELSKKSEQRIVLRKKKSYLEDLQEFLVKTFKRIF